MKRIVLLITYLTCLAIFNLYAQNPQSGGEPGGNFDPSRMNIGRLYGKVVDETGKGVGYATVQLIAKKFDPATGAVNDSLVTGQLTQDNGDFNLEKLSVMGDFELVISFLGYGDIRKTVGFGIPAMPSRAGNTNGPGMQNRNGSGMPSGSATPSSGGLQGGGMGMGNFEKDLGNIQLVLEATMLDEVVVTEEAPVTTLTIDRKSYRVDKDLTSAGGTAQDALKNVPSLSVDLDGNVSLRNGSPQIFVDGRQTTLSLDQISASTIESVEVITNPSAKFDAGGGTGGIVNIVLKKENRVGYNGNVRVGGDSQTGYNVGGDINARDGKINLFASGTMNQNRGSGEGSTLRNNFYGEEMSNVSQISLTEMRGNFLNGRAGLDYFVDNRNTLTLSGSIMRGKFKPQDEINTLTDLLLGDITETTEYKRISLPDRNFRNLGISAQFKHLFPRKGAEWTADVNFNKVRFRGGSNFLTTYDDGTETMERQTGLGRGSFLTLQADFINPINNRIKIEGGAKATMRDNRSDNMNEIFSDELDVWDHVPQLSDHYMYSDDILALYLQGSRQNGNWGVQAGLRAESSFYHGALTDRDSSFSITYPISVFPSVFVTRKINEGDQVQIAYTRRVNRPNFFQTMPFTDFSDSLNLRRGDPRLLPEFMNGLEISYQNIFDKGHNLLISLYYKQATNVITSYQFVEYNEDLGKEVVITTFANGDQASASGMEITLKNSFFDKLDITSNLNVFYSDVDASNVEDVLTTDRLSAFLKETIQLKLPEGFTLQFNGEYRTKASFVPVTNNDPFRGGGPPSQNTAQGYTKSYWFMDASLRKDFFQNKASLTLSVQDVFSTRKFGSYTETDFFTQETERFMNPQMVRLNFSYRFGKMDMSLFARKNNRMNMQGSDMMQ
ncbi:MAG TPA: outer membrane beta-barrel protein [Saprospiraceae bacterium]|nr:outer membrane beta-barrel protein [Saprospiraceae bacterium]